MNKTYLVWAFLLINFNLNAQVWNNFYNDSSYVQINTYFFDSLANELYIGGLFDNFNGIQANNIIKWNGTQWLGLGSGFNHAILSINKLNGVVYAAGAFDSSGTTPFKQPIAKWNGTQWLPLDTISQFNPFLPGLAVIHDIVEWNGSLIAAGNFHCFQNSLKCSGIARWGGSQWYPLAPLYNDLFSPVSTVLTVFQNDLYIGGTFVGIDSCPSTGMLASNTFAFIKYNQLCSTFVQIGNWPQGSGVNDFLVFNGNLYLAINVFPAWAGNFITRYDGTNFFPIGNGLNYDVESITEYQGQIVAVGRFTADGTNTQPLGHVGVWDGSNWNPLLGGCDLNKWVYHIFARDSLLFASGVFDSCGTTPVNYSVVYPNTITGLNQLMTKNNNMMKIFPNPANQLFTLTTSKYVESNKNEILINDVTAREISRTTMKNSSTEINASMWQPGLYIAKQIVNGEIISTSKIIISR